MSRHKPSARRRTTSRSRQASPLAAIVLAAGEGTRMKSSKSKVLHEVAGRTLVEHVVATAVALKADPIAVVVGNQSEDVRARLKHSFPKASIKFALQSERRGTGHAASAARPAMRGFDGDVLILCGDVPAMTTEGLRALVRQHRRQDNAITVLSAVLENPFGYGRIVRDGKTIQAIVEEKDADKEQKPIREINSGIYCARWADLSRALRRIKPDNAQGEYYLTDAVRLLLGRGHRAGVRIHERPEEILGVNSRRQLAQVGAIINQQKLDDLMSSGVTILDTASTWIQSTVRVGPDTTIHPGVTLEGRSRVGKNVIIRSGSRLTDVTVGDGAQLLEGTIAIDSKIGAGTSVGPFAHLRPGTVLGANCKIGNFVETKKALFGDGSKASHLSYVGDAQIGTNVNIGAGTITCNYDGKNKHLTKLGDDVFIGSDTQLVAPVEVGKGAYVAAGTTVTKDVEPGSLAIARTAQRNIEGWAERKAGNSQKRGGRGKKGVKDRS